MKRVVFPLLLVLIFACAGWYLLRRVPPHGRQEAAWLPGNTVLFEDMPNLHRTAERWPDTALAQILNEPEVQTFLSRPLGELPFRDELNRRLAQIKSIDPAHFFVGIAEWSGSGAPKAVAGLSYSGNKEDVESLVTELRKEAQETWPDGKSDIEKYGSGEIETFTTPTFAAALAYRGDWVFFSTDIGLLKSTLDRFEARPAPDCLAEQPNFKKCLQHLPASPDNLLYVRPDLLADKLSTLVMMLNPTADVQQMDKVKQIQAAGLAVKMDGLLMRDAVCAISPPEPGAEAPLAKDALKLSSANTVMAVARRLPRLEDMQLPDAKADPSGLIQMLQGYLKAFEAQGLGLKEFQQAFGPEDGVIVDWPAGFISYPSPLVMLDVRDAAMARKFFDTLANIPFAPGEGFVRQDEGGLSLYIMPLTGIAFLPLQVTLGLTDKCVVGGLSADFVTQAAKRMKSAAPGLAGSPDFLKTIALVPPPTVSFAYLDTKPIFERVYGMLSSVAAMGMIPHISDYVDVAKLPAPATISRHLSPIVSSGVYKDGIYLWESAGPVTTTQAIVFAAGLAGAAAVPIIQQQMNGQGFSFHGFPGMAPGAGKTIPNPFTSPLVPRNNANSQPPSSMPSATPAESPAQAASPSGGTP
ncbi:MAG TPA: hypothetical protein VHY22_13555 [Chthoniobacteraceae bacterium]|jgi:hypothetical protein|nr:hypothetical protein [Chthoniobacteraceae bacterium]